MKYQRKAAQRVVEYVRGVRIVLNAISLRPALPPISNAEIEAPWSARRRSREPALPARPTRMVS